MNPPFDIQEIKATLVLSLDLQQLEDYYNRYSSFRETLSDPHILRLLSEKFKVPFEKIKSFEDLIYSVSLHGDMEKVCGGEFQLLTNAIYWGKNSLDRLGKNSLELFDKIFENVDSRNFRDTDIAMRKAGRLINMVLKMDPPASVIRKLKTRYGILAVAVEAIKLQQNELAEKLMEGLGLSSVDIETLMAAAFGDNVEFFEKHLPIIEGSMRQSLLLHAAEGDAIRIIKLLRPKNDDYVFLLTGYLKAGNYQKVVESAERVPDDALIIQEDFYPVINSNCLQCLKYVEDRWGKFNIKDFIIYYNYLRPGAEKLTEVLWELMTRENSKLWRVVFENLLYEDDLEGLVRITQRFNPDLLFGESLYYRMIDNDQLNDCYRNWLSLQLEFLVL